MCVIQYSATGKRCMHVILGSFSLHCACHNGCAFWKGWYFIEDMFFYFNKMVWLWKNRTFTNPCQLSLPYVVCLGISVNNEIAKSRNHRLKTTHLLSLQVNFFTRASRYFLPLRNLLPRTSDFLNLCLSNNFHFVTRVVLSPVSVTVPHFLPRLPSERPGGRL